jgi:linoleoyl-CoA desaturase
MEKRLWYIAGRAYDLGPWLSRHPGGSEALLQAAGTDCTALFRSYHLMRAPALRLLARFEVAIDRSAPEHAKGLAGAHFTFEESGFYRTVQQRVRAALEERGTGPRASPLAQAWALGLLLASVVLIWPAYVAGLPAAALLLALVRGLGAVGPGHSTSHFSVFPRGRWNLLAFRIFSPFLVSNPAIWSAWHVQSHHVAPLTAVDLQDNYPLKRIQPAHPHRAWHRGQHFYIWLVYLLGLQLWSLQDFLVSLSSLFTQRFTPVRFPVAQRLENALVIGLNLLVTVALPFFFLDWQRALLVSLCANVPASFFVVIQIVVNHEVPETMDRVTPGAPIDWGVHQVLTSHNFGAASRVALHLSGGLNMQIEHHLFPGVHYTHFPRIAPIVQRACAEFGLPYHSSRSVFEAMAKHYRILRLNSVPTP